MDPVGEWNKAVGWAEYLGLPKIFPRMGNQNQRNQTAENGRLTKRLVEEPARTPAPWEVGAQYIPVKLIAPRKLLAGSPGAEPSMVPRLMFPAAVDSQIWVPQTVKVVPAKPLTK